MTLLHLVVFASLSPLGLALGKGFLLQRLGDLEAELTVRALATGSLLYITLFELLLPAATAANGIKNRMAALALPMAIGAGVMVLSQIVAGEE